jgi:hypothetical protein
MDKQDAINLIPKAYADLRAKIYAEIIWQETQTGAFDWGNEDNSYLVTAIAAFVPTIAPFSARLSAAQRRAFLRELPSLIRLAGTNFSITRTLEIFGYTANLIENPGGAAGTFRVQIAQAFVLAEATAIVNTFKPVGRVLTGVQGFDAILLDGTRLFNGTTTLS